MSTSDIYTRWFLMTVTQASFVLATMFATPKRPDQVCVSRELQ